MGVSQNTLAECAVKKVTAEIPVFINISLIWFTCDGSPCLSKVSNSKYTLYSLPAMVYIYSQYSLCPSLTLLCLSSPPILCFIYFSNGSILPGARPAVQSIPPRKVPVVTRAIAGESDEKSNESTNLIWSPIIPIGPLLPLAYLGWFQCSKNISFAKYLTPAIPKGCPEKNPISTCQYGLSSLRILAISKSAAGLQDSSTPLVKAGTIP